jgi:hypothetical protein
MQLIDELTDSYVGVANPVYIVSSVMAFCNHVGYDVGATSSRGAESGVATRAGELS